VDGRGDGRARVPQTLGDHLHRHAVGAQEHGMGVAQVVQRMTSGCSSPRCPRARSTWAVERRENRSGGRWSRRVRSAPRGVPHRAGWHLLTGRPVGATRGHGAGVDHLRPSRRPDAVPGPARHSPVPEGLVGFSRHSR
jgi:hypothetical protein